MTFTHLRVEKIVTRKNGAKTVVCRLQAPKGAYRATVLFRLHEVEHIERLRGLDTALGRFDGEHNVDFDVAEFLLDAIALRE